LGRSGEAAFPPKTSGSKPLNPSPVRNTIAGTAGGKGASATGAKGRTPTRGDLRRQCGRILAPDEPGRARNLRALRLAEANEGVGEDSTASVPDRVHVGFKPPQPQSGLWEVRIVKADGEKFGPARVAERQSAAGRAALSPHLLTVNARLTFDAQPARAKALPSRP
jgi:hypothetical protein